MIDRFLQRLARLALAIFFRRVEVIGQERFPPTGPVLAVANHVNSLIDAVLLVATLPRMPRFLAKSTLWQMTGLLPFLRLAQVIPVYRRQDVGEDTTKNLETFAKSHEVLKEGGVIGLFPEGISHNEPSLQPLKTGAARIALEAEGRFGPLGVQIVPLGMIFEAKGKFRSRVLVQMGSPIPLPAGAQTGVQAEDREAVQALTAKIEESLRGLTVNYQSWREARLLARAADLYGRPLGELPGSPPLKDRVGLRQRFLAGYRVLKQSLPEAVAEVERAVEEYDLLLKTAGLRDDQVAARYPWHRVLAFAGSTLYHLLLRLPLAVLGIVLNLLPYQLTAAIARRLTYSPDTESSYKLFPGLFAYPLLWLAQATAAGFFLGWRWGLILALVAPLTGWIALRFLERRDRFFRETRAFLKLRTRSSLSKELRAQRQRVLEQVAELVRLYQEGQGGGGVVEAGLDV